MCKTRNSPRKFLPPPPLRWSAQIWWNKHPRDVAWACASFGFTPGPWRIYFVDISSLAIGRYYELFWCSHWILCLNLMQIFYQYYLSSKYGLSQLNSHVEFFDQNFKFCYLIWLQHKINNVNNNPSLCGFVKVFCYQMFTNRTRKNRSNNAKHQQREVLKEQFNSFKSQFTS